MRRRRVKQLEEKLEAEMKLLNDRVHHDLPLTEAERAAWRRWMGLVPSSSSSGRRRKKKKRRKRRLPRGVRIRLCGQKSRSRSSLSGAQCSLWSSTGLRCPASWLVCTKWTAPRSSSFLAVACAMLVWLVTIHLALCYLLASSGSGCSASWPIWTRRNDSSCVVVDSWQWHVQIWFYWLFCTSFCFSRPPVVLPRCSASWPVWTSLTVSWCSCFRLQQTVEFPQLQSLMVVDISCRGAEADSHGLAVSADQSNSPVARGQGGRCPYFTGRARRRFLS